MSAERINQDLAAVEAALASLQPAPWEMDRDRLMYLAGRAAGSEGTRRRKDPHTHWLWPCTTAATALVAACLGAMLLLRGEPPAVERIVYVERDRAADLPAPVGGIVDIPREQPSPGADYLLLRQLVLTKGIDAWPSPAPASAGDLPIPRWDSGSRDVLRRLLEG